MWISIFGIIFLFIVYILVGMYFLEIESDWWPYENYESIYWKLIRRKIKSLTKNKPNEYKYDENDSELCWYYKNGSQHGVLALLESPDINLYDNWLVHFLVIFWPICCLIELINYTKYKISN